MGSFDGHAKSVCAVVMEGLDRIGVALSPEASSTSMQLPHNLEGLLEEARAVATSLLALASCLSATSVTQTG